MCIPFRLEHQHQRQVKFKLDCRYKPRILNIYQIQYHRCSRMNVPASKEVHHSWNVCWVVPPHPHLVQQFFPFLFTQQPHCVSDNETSEATTHGCDQPATYWLAAYEPRGSFPQPCRAFRMCTCPVAKTNATLTDQSGAQRTRTNLEFSQLLRAHIATQLQTGCNGLQLAHDKHYTRGHI